MNAKQTGFKFQLIDTPGYDHDKQNDNEHFEDIKRMLSSDNYNIKGIFLVFSFQDVRFSDSHRQGFEKIVNLVPLDDFWKYFGIIFTKTYKDPGDDDDLEDIKKEKLEKLKEIFQPLIKAYKKVKNIKEVDFSIIKKVFVNLNKKKTKKTDEQLKELLNVFNNNSKLPKLFHKLEIEDKEKEQIFILDRDNQNKGKLFECKLKLYKYYNSNNEIIKTFVLPDKNTKPKFIKEITKTEFDRTFQRFCNTVSDFFKYPFEWGMQTVMYGSLFFPPLAKLTFPYIFWGMFGLFSSAFVPLLAAGVKDIIEDNINKEFNSQKICKEEEIINEILNDF